MPDPIHAVHFPLTIDRGLGRLGRSLITKSTSSSSFGRSCLLPRGSASIGRISVLASSA